MFITNKRYVFIKYLFFSFILPLIIHNQQVDFINYNIIKKFISINQSVTTCMYVLHKVKKPKI